MFLDARQEQIGAGHRRIVMQQHAVDIAYNVFDFHLSLFLMITAGKGDDNTPARSGGSAFQQSLQEHAVEHRAFGQGESADRRAMIEFGGHHRQILRKSFSTWVLMQLWIAGSSTLSASVISPAITTFCGLNRLMAMATALPR